MKEMMPVIYDIYDGKGDDDNQWKGKGEEERESNLESGREVLKTGKEGGRVKQSVNHFEMKETTNQIVFILQCVWT